MLLLLIYEELLASLGIQENQCVSDSVLGDKENDNDDIRTNRCVDDNFFFFFFLCTRLVATKLAL